MPTSAIRAAFMDAVGALEPLFDSAELAERWAEPSVLREWQVAGVAGHLLRCLEAVLRYLDAPSPGKTEHLTSAADYYTEVLPAGIDLDDPVHVSIRTRGIERADVGALAIGTRVRELGPLLRDRLAAEPADRQLRVVNDLAMTLDDYLITRIVEVTVHGDDLAASLALETPRFSDATLELAISTLVATARQRHGDVAVLRALTRRERDEPEALRVL